MTSKYMALMLFTALLMGCDIKTETITKASDYNNYLALSEHTDLERAKSNLKFWNEKLENQPTQYPYLAKLASANSKLFGITGKIEYLKNAEDFYVQVNERTDYTQPSYLQSLAQNYISQHKFKEALEMLNKAELLGDKLVATQKMLFDVHLELGNYQLAQTYLSKFENYSDFDYLIRLAKWSDHKGDLDAAIKYMEKAVVRAESSNLDHLKLWAYTNIADFYGHAGNIKDSYQHYLKSLAINPNDAYSKKGIAWILYSHENNPDEALRILNTVTETYHAPDYYLLKAEIAEYQDDQAMKEQQMRLYEEAMTNVAYGDMYNKYNVLLLCDDHQKTQNAIALAKIEIANRPTPQSYDLLAWAHFNEGNITEALNIIDLHVINKTYEPESLYHAAEIYKAAGKDEMVAPIKKELVASLYELGPNMVTKINKL